MSSSSTVSPNSFNANSGYLNAKVKAHQSSVVSQVSQYAQKTVKTAKSDTVTISPQALSNLSSNGGAKAQEAKGSGVGKAVTSFRTVA